MRKVLTGMIDRFGPLPAEVEQLADIVRLRWQACQVGFEKLTLKKNLLKGYIPATGNEAYFQGDTFGNILSYVQTHTRSASMKERKEQLILSIEDVKNVQAAKRILNKLGREETWGLNSNSPLDRRCFFGNSAYFYYPQFILKHCTTFGN
ncbi:hypothetical protein LRS06_11095 [Hymenobacter sp. J193]|nr:hypothetical protein [Hymenobacter sp. J193]